MKIDGHIVRLNRREARLLGGVEALELPQDGVLKSKQEAYDELHATRERIANDGVWLPPFLIDSLVKILEVDRAIWGFEGMHRRFGRVGIDSGLQIGNPAHRKNTLLFFRVSPEGKCLEMLASFKSSYRKLRVSGARGAPYASSLKMALTSRVSFGKSSCSVLLNFCSTKSAESICSGFLGPMPTRTRP